ncbi:MAG: NADH-quinone oxidoreductase subunit L, partial [Bacteroidetes bacterium]|nr:NADH-quinone oxidoreductase subunit L [Bacteroidota bacterium]
MEKFAWLIPALPLAGFIISIFAGKKLPEKVLASIASVAILIPFIITLGIFIPFASATEPEAIRILLMEWMSIGKFSVNFSFQLDQLSLMMMLVITGVGFLIHVYSAGYMHGDEGFNRFFAYLNLFVFFMLMLVMGSNYLMLFIGWEGVGLCSFLLIGFWHTNPEYAKAANKAFIMNRIGDLGLLLGIFLLFMRFSTLEYNRIMFEAESISMGDPIVVSATLLLFIGAIGKSAQIPLFTWLPDAMAGPTPVSALIHAATMVTAGVYLIIRSNVLFTLAPFTQEIIMIVGLATAIFAATIGLKQNDIKKVLAYSTVSQLGYMFFALGLGAYTAAYFHLFTHAFFKALLFLGSGSVIHAMSGEQDMRKMGGLKSALPVTHLTFLIGTIAIAGLPPLAGFFSKDEILAAAWHHNPVLWILGVGGALLTAFYMFRLYFLTFHGQFRGSEEQKHHLHESPASIT